MILLNINEAYFGKTKDLLAAEAQLDKFRNKYMGKYILNPSVNSDQDLLYFDRIMENIFGFGCFTLHVHNQAVLNAFTMPIDYRYDYGNPKDNIIADKKGYRFKEEYDYAALLGIYSGLIFNPEFTTSEVMAIILHEIGHNFNSALNKSNGVMTSIFTNIEYLCILISGSPISYVQAINNTNDARKFYDKTGKKWRENNNIPIAVYDTIKQLQAFGNAGINILNDIVRVSSMGTLTLLCVIINGLTSALKSLNPITIITKIFKLKINYRSELTADNFPTIYGYGGDLASALQKMEDTEGDSPSVIMNAFNKIPIVSSVMHMTEQPAYILASIFDEHPNSLSRVHDQLDLLNRELSKNNIDPKMARYIKEDIKVCNKALDDLTDISKGISDPYYGRKLYNKIIEKCTFKAKLLGDDQKFAKYDELFNK